MKPHRADLVSLFFGLLFTVVAGWWAVSYYLNWRIDWNVPNLGWIAAGALILIGLLGVVASLRGERAVPEPVAPPYPVPPSAPTSAPPSAPTSGAAATESTVDTMEFPEPLETPEPPESVEPVEPVEPVDPPAPAADPERP